MIEEKLAIYIQDTSYGRAEGDEWEAQSEKLKAALEAEFQQRFEEVDIGPGASDPAFLTWISVTVGGLVWLFFKGKEVKENLDGWRPYISKILPFLWRNPTLDRKGASLVALNALFSKIDSLPRSVQLIGYRPHSLLSGEDESIDPTEVADDAPMQYMGTIVHIFLIDVNSRRYRVSVWRSEIREMAER